MSNFFILQASPGGGMTQTLIMFALIGVVFYFFMIRPQQKKQKEQTNFRTNIKRGDSVVTIGGVHGKVFSIDDDLVVIEVDKGVQLTVEKTAISVEYSTKLAGKK